VKWNWVWTLVLVWSRNSLWVCTTTERRSTNYTY
jgi:hypothetical protein